MKAYPFNATKTAKDITDLFGELKETNEYRTLLALYGYNVKSKEKSKVFEKLRKTLYVVLRDKPKKRVDKLSEALGLNWLSKCG